MAFLTHPVDRWEAGALPKASTPSSAEQVGPSSLSGSDLPELSFQLWFSRGIPFSCPQAEILTSGANSTVNADPYSHQHSTS